MLEKASPQLRGLTNRFRSMLGVSKPHEIIEHWRPYNVAELAPRIRCPMLFLYGEAEAAQSSEKVGMSALRFIGKLSCPVSVRLFGFDEGWAATHCQIGALAPMQAVVFDWLDRVINKPEGLPRHDIGENVGRVFSRYIRSGKARRELGKILMGMQSG
jgi:hypothetical protein